MDVIETARLVLRHQATEDAPFVLALMNDPAWLANIGDRGVRTLDQARAYILDGAIRMYRDLGFGLYLVETRTDRTPVGICGVLRRDYMDDVEVGFAIAREHRGHGFAREAAAATLKHARDAFGLDRIVATISPGNLDSIRLVLKLGLTLERKFENPDGKALELYAIDWHQSSSHRMRRQ